MFVWVLGEICSNIKLVECGGCVSDFNGLGLEVDE